MDFVSKILLKTWLFKCYALKFGQSISTQNPRFLHDELIFRKNMVYMKNAEERVGLKIFWPKILKMKSSLSKSTKTIENCAIYLLS
jgi:hypothetical protein